MNQEVLFSTDVTQAYNLYRMTHLLQNSMSCNKQWEKVLWSVGDGSICMSVWQKKKKSWWSLHTERYCFHSPVLQRATVPKILLNIVTFAFFEGDEKSTIWLFWSMFVTGMCLFLTVYCLFSWLVPLHQATTLEVIYMYPVKGKVGQFHVFRLVLVC